MHYEFTCQLVQRSVHLQPESETLHCARPVFASEELTWLREGEQLSYLLPKPLPFSLSKYLINVTWLKPLRL